MRVTALDSQPLLSKIITGTSNTPIGTFIQFLNASDWVKQGIELAEKSNGRCPFCQQELPSSLAEQIAAFFDEEYKKTVLLSRNINVPIPSSWLKLNCI